MPSTVIRAYEYSAERRELRITFQSGRRYVYRDVPTDTHDAMKSAFAKGSSSTPTSVGASSFSASRTNAPGG